MANEEKQKQFDDIRERKHRNSSRTNPFKTSHVEDFNFWYFLIGIIGIMYGTMSWQGSQAYNSSAKSAHEAKMGLFLLGFVATTRAFFLLVPVLLYVFMNHSEYQDIAVSVQSSLNQFETVTLQDQMRGPLILSTVLPVGLIGAFAALMLAAFVSTHDTYLHSWATILVQDVINAILEKNHLIKIPI